MNATTTIVGAVRITITQSLVTEAVLAGRITEREAHFVWLIHSGDFHEHTDTDDMTEYFAILEKIVHGIKQQ